ncbi:PilW family protein [Nitrosomonas eutropha]|uniref:PilW family protein n=1 Tax=Nitrosomonas eutropha TaxID=916 RepID=UPI0008CD62E2|nr:PilW family protein [Nitrosomonas eutropha]SEJ23743.1 type IV pilus assembly protein PilW [Nitrosomonas eutropha]
MKSMRVNQAFSRSQQGLTLVEMMVAMTIGLVLLGGVITVLTASQQTYRVNEALARMQENARYAFQLLSRDIRMAGYWGCGGVVPQDMDPPLEGAEAATDTLVVRGVEGDGIRVLSHSPNLPNPNFTVSSGNELKVGQTVLVSNCQAAAILHITEVKPPSGKEVSYTIMRPNPRGDFTFTNGEAVRISTREYYIGTGKSGVPALFQTSELVEGIENMQIQYGEDTDGDRAVDTYRTADLVADWENVVSVRIDLLVQSVEDNVTSQPQTYTFNGETVTPTDRRLRQAFSTVISLRNRAP